MEFCYQLKKGRTLEVVEGLRNEKRVCRLYDISPCGFVYLCWVKDISKIQLLSVGWHHASSVFVFPQISSPQQASGHVNPDCSCCHGHVKVILPCCHVFCLSLNIFTLGWFVSCFGGKWPSWTVLEIIPFSVPLHTCWRKSRLITSYSIMPPPPFLRKVWKIVFLYGLDLRLQSFDAPEMKRLKLKAGAWSCQPWERRFFVKQVYLDWSSLSSFK